MIIVVVLPVNATGLRAIAVATGGRQFAKLNFGPERDDGFIRHQHPDSPHPFGLLRPRRQRPSHRAAEPRDELPPSHSITSSALAARAIRWLIALMVLCCDLMAIALTAGIGTSINRCLKPY
jgi:hypothetical protein